MLNDTTKRYSLAQEDFFLEALAAQFTMQKKARKAKEEGDANGQNEAQEILNEVSERAIMVLAETQKAFENPQWPYPNLAELQQLRLDFAVEFAKLLSFDLEKRTAPELTPETIFFKRQFFCSVLQDPEKKSELVSSLQKKFNLEVFEEGPLQDLLISLLYDGTFQSQSEVDLFKLTLLEAAALSYDYPENKLDLDKMAENMQRLLSSVFLGRIIDPIDLARLYRIELDQTTLEQLINA